MGLEIAHKRLTRFSFSAGNKLGHPEAWKRMKVRRNLVAHRKWGIAIRARRGIHKETMRNLDIPRRRPSPNRIG